MKSKSTTKKKPMVIKKKTVAAKNIETKSTKTWSRSIKTAISHWRKQTNQQFRKLAIVVIIIGIAQITISWVSQYTGVQMWFGPDVWYRPVDFIGSIIGMWLGLGFADIAIRTNQNKPWTTKTLFSNIHLLGKYIIAYILMWLAILLGFVLLIVPGIYVAYRLSFMQYYMVDQNSGPIEALKQSRYATKWHIRKLIWLSLLFVLINILWLLVVWVGLLWTIPTTIIAYAYVYERIK